MIARLANGFLPELLVRRAGAGMKNIKGEM
jgi:hypothetical protein